MTVSAEAKRWLRKKVRAFYADNQTGTHATGEVVAYCDAPTVTIRTEDGELVSWRVDLTEEVKR